MKKNKHIEETYNQKYNQMDFDMSLVKFSRDEPFYGNILCYLDKFKTEKIPTAAVSLNDNKKPFLMWNESFWKSLCWQHRQGLLIHELMHIIFGHLGKRTPDDKTKRDIWYQACDYAINSLIPIEKLPPLGLIPGVKQQIPKDILAKSTPEQIAGIQERLNFNASLPKKQSAEKYYKILLNKFEEYPQMLDSSNFFSDEHEEGNGDEEQKQSGGNISEEEAEELKEYIKKIVDQAAESSMQNKAWGSASAAVRKVLDKLYSETINWRMLLSIFVGRVRSPDKSTSIKKINKRYPYIHPGRKRKHQCRVAICMDQSGSVSHKQIRLFFAELDHLAELVDFYVIPFDHSVIENKIFKWEKGQKIQPKRDLNGGTSFDAPTRWINENSHMFDAVIFMTDGFCSQPIHSIVPRAWVILPKGKLLFETNEFVIKMN